MEINVEALLARMPEATQADMDRARLRVRRLTLVLLRTGPASREDEARNERLHREHLLHLTRLQMAGKLVLNGPVLVEHDLVGVSIYAADPDEARALAEADPKVRAGYLTVEALPWIGVPSETGAPLPPPG